MPSRRRVQPPAKEGRPTASKPPDRTAAPPTSPQRGASSPSRTAPASRRPRSRARYVPLLASVVLVLGALGGFLWWRTSSAAQQTPATQLGPVDTCRRLPRFVSSLGLGSSVSVSTTQPKVVGLVLGNSERLYQDATWDDAGTLGPFALDREGNIYVAPVPRVAVTDIVSGTANTIFRVDTQSGKMEPFLSVPPAGPASGANVFGIVGMTYDCDTHSLYVATLAGSTRDVEMGQVVRVDLAQKRVVPEVTGVDALGVGVANTADGKRLYIGAARASDVYVVLLDRAGDVAGTPHLALSFGDHDVYGNARVRRFSFSTSEQVEMLTIPFAFNLRAGSDKLQQQFSYIYDSSAGAWRYQIPLGATK